MAAVVDTYLKWPASRKTLLWVGFTVLVGLGYYFLGFQPRLQELRGLEDRYERLGRELRENQAIADNLPRVKEEVRHLDEKLAEALQKLPNREEIPDLLQTISDLGKDSGLEFLLFKPGGSQPKDFYAEVPLEMQVLGRYHDVAVFFDKVGRLPRIVTIVSSEFGNPKPEAGGVKLTVSCRAVTYKFLEPGEKAAADKKRKKKGGRR
ncbi:MAG: type 4a pilus biogenesis protein PilO [Deltaproteobacteria bacterium]|nr:type 4a pilus biogenesis protein PilO [Deltaproteobacteria bacterium]